MKDLGGRALKARRRRSGHSDAPGALRCQVSAPGLGPGEVGPRAPGGSRHAVQSALAHQPAHVGVTKQKKMGKRRAQIKRAAREARISPAPGNLPSTPSGQDLPASDTPQQGLPPSAVEELEKERAGAGAALPGSVSGPSEDRKTAIPGHGQCPYQSGHRRIKDPEH